MSKQKIKDYITQIRGVSYKPADVIDAENGIPIIRANNIQDDGMIYNDLVFVTPQRIRDNQLLKEGDVVICTSSGSKNLVGKATTFNGYESDMSFGAFCKGIRINSSSVNPDFIRLFFKSKTYREQISASSIGANINNIKAEHIDNLLINIPSVETQNIAVGELYTLIKSISIKKQQLLALDDLVKSRFIEMFGEIDYNPNNYPIVTIDDVCHKVTDGKHGGCQKQEDSGYYYVGAREIFDGEIHYDTAPQITYTDFAKDYKRCNIEVGDLVIVNTGATIGKSAIAKSPLTDHTLLQKSVALYKVNKDIVNVLFLQYCYMTHPSLYLVEGAAAQPNLLISTIKTTKIYLPSMELQNEFAEFVKLTDKSKFIVQKQIEDLQELLDKKMDEYFG